MDILHFQWGYRRFQKREVPLGVDFQERQRELLAVGHVHPLPPAGERRPGRGCSGGTRFIGGKAATVKGARRNGNRQHQHRRHLRTRHGGFSVYGREQTSEGLFYEEIGQQLMDFEGAESNAEFIPPQAKVQHTNEYLGGTPKTRGRLVVRR